MLMSNYFLGISISVGFIEEIKVTATLIPIVSRRKTYK